jgi:hypothetical protein
MRFQIVLIAFLGIAVEMISGKKNKWLKKPLQKVDMNNKATSNSNSLAVNAGVFGDANAFSGSDASNFNMIGQNAS